MDALRAGEPKKRQCNYCRCTGNRGKCPEPYTRPELLTDEFANVLQGLVIPPQILEWLGDAVLATDRTEQAAHAQLTQRLKARREQIQARLEKIYIDQLDGIITPEFYSRQSASWRREQDELRRIQDIHATTPAPADQVIHMLTLTSVSSESFLQQRAEEQCRFLAVIVE